MDDRFKQILGTLSEKPPRSRLEPYREFIEELRRMRRTYRDIAAILAEKCQLQVSASAVHDFVRIRSRGKGKLGPESSARRTEPRRSPAAQQIETAIKTNATGDDLRRRIAALKVEKEAAQPTPDRFQFDPSEPLRLRKVVRTRSDDE